MKELLFTIVLGFASITWLIYTILGIIWMNPEMYNTGLILMTICGISLMTYEPKNKL